MENVEEDVIPIIYSKEEDLKNLISIENPKKIKKLMKNFLLLL